jgi:hypothetical protein
MGKPIYGNIDLLSYLESTQPHEVYRVQEAFDPRKCEHAGFEEALRERGKRPWVIFEQSLRADGGKWWGLFSMRRANGRIHRFRCRGKNSWKIVEDFRKSWDCRSYSPENRGSDMNSATGLTRKEKKQNWRWRETL